MICWIAGWPHNGSTLCRQILKDSFEIPTYSCYLENELESLFPGSVAFYNKWNTNPMVKHKYFLEHADTYFVKTHDLPIDNAPAIFVYRDGRDAVASLSNFWGIPIDNATCGIGCRFGTWSAHYHAWDGWNRPITLMVKYEDMVNKPNDVAQDIAKFLEYPQKHQYIDDFEEKKKKFPYLFKDRIGVWEKQMSKENLDLFWKCHKGAMEELGYAK